MPLPCNGDEIASHTVGDFLSRLAAPTATPGGGAVVALTGAMSAALISMAAGITRTSKRYAGVASEMTEVEGRARLLIDDFQALADADVAAYNAVMSARSLSAGSDREAAMRSAAIDIAMSDATRVQLHVAEACVQALELAEIVAARGIRQAHGDVAVAAMGAHNAMRGALSNVEINAGAVRDAAFSSWCSERQNSLRMEGDRRYDVAMAASEGTA